MDQDEIRALLKRAASGDREAAGELAERFERPVRSAIRRRLGKDLRARVDTDDIFQSAIVSAWLALSTFRSDGDRALVNWLSAIAEQKIRNAARIHQAERRDIRREKQLDTAERVPAASTSPTHAAIRRELSDRVHRAVTELPELDRRVVELHSFEGLPFRTVARNLGLTGKSAARRVFHRALKMIGEAFSTEYS